MRASSSSLGVVGLAAILALVACDVPADPVRAREALVLPGKGIVLVAVDIGTVAAVRTGDGSTIWKYRPPKPPPVPYISHPGGFLACVPILAKNSTIVLGYSDRIAVVDSDTGLERWAFTYAQHNRETTACPSVSPDSGVIFVIPNERRGKNTLVKLDPEGKVQWRTLLPDVGVVVGAPQVDDATGDMVVQTRAYVVGINPIGLVNWVRPRAVIAQP